MTSQTSSGKALVPIVSAWYSKINWTQAGAAATAIIVAAGIDIPDNVKAEVLTGLTIAQSILTWVFRTWFNGSVNPASM